MYFNPGLNLITSMVAPISSYFQSDVDSISFMIDMIFYFFSCGVIIHDTVEEKIPQGKQKGELVPPFLVTNKHSGTCVM